MYTTSFRLRGSKLHRVSQNDSHSTLKEHDANSERNIRFCVSRGEEAKRQKHDCFSKFLIYSSQHKGTSVAASLQIEDRIITI